MPCKCCACACVRDPCSDSPFSSSRLARFPYSPLFSAQRRPMTSCWTTSGCTQCKHAEVQDENPSLLPAGGGTSDASTAINTSLRIVANRVCIRTVGDRAHGCASSEVPVRGVAESRKSPCVQPASKRANHDAAQGARVAAARPVGCWWCLTGARHQGY